MPEQEYGAGFPVAGIDVTCEFGRQPADTTPQAANVRSFDTIAERARGGSRAGLSKYISETHSGDFEIQHLNILVDPQNPALAADVDDGTLLDPSTNNTFTRNFGRLIRPGGGGRQPNRNDPRASGNITLVQSKQQSFSNSTDPIQIEFNAQPGLNNMVVVFIHVSVGNAILADINNFVSGFTQAGDVRNGGAGVYTQIGGGGFVSQFTKLQSALVPGSPRQWNSMSCWYKRASAGIQDKTVLVNSPADTHIVTVGPQQHFTTVNVRIAEFRNLANAPNDPVQASESTGAASASPGTFFGPVGNQKAFFWYTTVDRPPPVSGDPGGSLEPSGYNVVGGVSNSQCKFRVGTENEMTPIYTPASTPIVFGSIGFSWNKG